MEKVKLTNAIFKEIDEYNYDYVYYLYTKFGSKKVSRVIIYSKSENKIYYSDRKLLNITNAKMWETLDNYLNPEDYNENTDNIKVYINKEEMEKNVIKYIKEESEAKKRTIHQA